MQILTTDNAPAVDALVNATDYLGNVHTGRVAGREWMFDRLMAIELDIRDAAGFSGRRVTIWAGRDSFELARLLNQDTRHSTDCVRYIIGSHVPCDCPSYAERTGRCDYCGAFQEECACG